MSNYSIEVINFILSGYIEIDNIIAQILEDILGPTKQFWLNKEFIYRNGLKRLNLMIPVNVSYKQILSVFGAQMDSCRQRELMGVHHVDNWIMNYIYNDKLMLELGEIFYKYWTIDLVNGILKI